MKKSLVPWLGHLPFLLPVLALSLFGVAMVYSAGVLNIPSPVTQGLWLRQSVVLGGCIVALFVVSRVPIRWFQWTAMPVYIVTVAVLAATLILGTGQGTAEGMRSFLSVFGFRFQPAEAAKVATVLVLAKLLAGREGPPEYLRELLLPGIVAGVPLLLVLLQPDIGTAMAFAGIFFAVIYWARTPWPLIVFAASPAVALILSFNTIVWSAGFVILLIGLYLYRFRLYLAESLFVVIANLAAGAMAQPLWNSLADYQRNRLLVFLDPELDPRGAGWQLVQSKVAVGSGGLMGKGFTLGTQKRLDFLPEQHTDFVFSVVGEEFGFVGTSLTLLLFGYLFFRMIQMAEESHNHFAGLFIFGIIGIWLTHVVVNIGMTVGVVPITGIPLPFISYGGSFLLMSWLAAAVAVSMASEKP